MADDEYTDLHFTGGGKVTVSGSAADVAKTLDRSHARDGFVELQSHTHAHAHNRRLFINPSHVDYLEGSPDGTVHS